jgi:5'-nucleotidase / UDP-sugar diphosphatase
MKRAALLLGFVALVVGPGARAGPIQQPGTAPVAASQEQTATPWAGSPLTILQINDVYSTIPIDGAGGLARVATLKQQLAAAGRTPLLVLAGDFLSPSVASSVFKGEQMIAALNAAGLDLATLGNHEFDFGDDLLIERMRQATWTWVVSNVIDTRTGKPIGGAVPYLVRTFGGLKVGFIGRCLTTTEISRDKLKHTRLLDPIATAARYVPILQRRGATVIVAVTHLAFADDRALATRFPQIDLIIGGHEHYPITSVEGRTLISKAGSDAKWVARIDVNRRRPGPLERFYDLIPIGSSLPDEPRTAGVVAAFETRLGTALDAVVGSTTVPLDASTIRSRSAETNLGDFFADAIRADAHADIALMNSGSIRGDRVYPAGPLTKRTLLAMHPFGNVVCTIALPGRVVVDALEHGVEKLPATAGQFPQVSGLTMRVDGSAPAGHRVSDVRVNGKPIDPTATYTLATPDYVLKGGDGYTMFAGQRVLIGPESGNLLVGALEHLVTARSPIAPQVEGRIVLVR